jgi:hypothetical protein
MNISNAMTSAKRNTKVLTRLSLLTLVGLGLVTLAWSAITPDQRKWTLDGGGVTSIGGGFKVSGSIGQHDAKSSAGGPYFLRGGFWPESETTATGVEGPPIAGVERFQLHPNSPNPFNPATTIRFDLPNETDAQVEVFNLRGARVRILHTGPLAAGAQALLWDGRDDRGAALASGIYLVQVRAGEDVARQKVSLIK